MQLSKPHPNHPGYRTRPAHDVFPQDIECVLQATSTHGAIYIGNLQAAENLQTLQKYKISSLLTACKNIRIKHPKQYVAYSLYIPGQDHQNYDLSLHFETAVNFINQSLKETNILVHCMAGVSRSVTLVIAYLIKHKNMNFQQAFKSVQNKRRKINPNPGFIRQLQTYQQKITRPHYNSYSHEFDRYKPTNSSFVDKTKSRNLYNQNLIYDSSNYRVSRQNDQLKLNQKYQNFSKLLANNLQYSNARTYNPENEQYYRPRTNYLNKQDQNSSFLRQSYLYNPTKMLRESREQRMSTTLTQITNQSSYNPTNRNSNIENLSRDLDDRIAKIKQKYYQGKQINLNRSLVTSQDKRVRNEVNLQNNGITRQSFSCSIFNSNNGFRPLNRQYI